MLNTKTFISFKISGVPLYSNNLSKRINEYQDFIKNNNYDKYESNDLCIINVHGLYGYRTGIIGYFLNYTSYKLSKNNNPTFLQKYINGYRKNKIIANDFEMLSYYFSLFFRTVPFLNFGNWDLKNKLFFKNFHTPNKNLSLPSIFNLNSLYLLSPLYDSGSRIYCNKPAKMSGFEKWTISDEILFNRGITWSYFESDNKENGIMVLNIEIDSDELIEPQIYQIINFKNKFEQEIISSGIKKYETFISGDFKIEFNLKDTIPEIKKIWDMLEENFISIYNNTENDSVSNTHFILYSKYNISDAYDISENENEQIISKYTILDDTLYSINFVDKEEENTDEIKNKDIKIDINDDIEKDKNVLIDIPQETTIKNNIFISMDSFKDNHFENTKHSSDEEWTEI